ncbi:hypothetical protein [Microbulbifer okhotskensis]|nr:hypothetical protein [Microbulbifer okhotskensis]
MLNVELHRTSGITSLDREVVALVRWAEPCPHHPIVFPLTR